MRYILDTNICIYSINRKSLQILQNFEAKNLDDIYISSITEAELLYGVEKSMYKAKNLQKTKHFLEPIKVLSFDSMCSKYYAQIRASLEKKGQVIGRMDMLIASVALANNMTLVTNNEKEFCRIPNLVLENWS